MDGTDGDRTWLVDPFQTIPTHIHRFVHDVLRDNTDNEDNGDNRTTDDYHVLNNNNDGNFSMVRTGTVIEIDTFMDRTVILPTITGHVFMFDGRKFRRVDVFRPYVVPRPRTYVKRKSGVSLWPYRPPSQLFHVLVLDIPGTVTVNNKFKFHFRI